MFWLGLAGLFQRGRSQREELPTKLSSLFAGPYSIVPKGEAQLKRVKVGMT